MRKWRRRGTDEDVAPAAAADAAAGTDGGDDSAATDEAPKDLRAAGPWDASERPVDADDPARLHLGSLSVLKHPELKLHFQVDQATDTVTAVMFLAGDGAMELHAYAAPRNEDTWDGLRAQLATEAVRRGGKAGEVDGPFGKGLQMVLPATTPEGEQVAQMSTVLGIPGPRWLLRATMFGRPATEFRSDGLLETVLLTTVVQRGNAPMAPGDTLPLSLPAGARRVGTPADGVDDRE